MGKENNKKNKRNRAKPAGAKGDAKEESVEADLGEIEANSTNSLQEMAASSSSITRSSACTTYGMLFEGMRSRGGKKSKNKGDKSALNRMVDQGAPALLCGLLCSDQDMTVRAQAAGALRSLIGALEVLTPFMVDHLSQAGMAASLVTSIQQSLSGVKEASNAAISGIDPTAATKLVVQTNILERSIAASVALLQASPTSMKPFMEVGIPGSLLEFIEAACTDDILELDGIISVMRRSAQMLQRCLESNPELAVMLTQTANGGATGRDRLVVVLSRLPSKTVGDRDTMEVLKVACIHIAGCLVNMHKALVEVGKDSPDATTHTLQAILPPLLSLLSVDSLPLMGPAQERPEAPAEEGFVATLSEEEETSQMVWATTCARFVIILEVMNDLMSAFDCSVDESESGEEWASDDEAGMEAAAASQGGSVGLSASDAFKKTCLKSCLVALEQANVPAELLTCLERLMAVQTTNNMILPDHITLIGDVCDVRNHLCLVLAKTCCVERASPCGPIWARLVAVARQGVEEASVIGEEVAGQWLPSLGNALFACLESDPTFCTVSSTEPAEHPTQVMTFLQVLVGSTNSEVQLHAVRCVGVLTGRWLSNEQLCGEYGNGGVSVLLSSLESGYPLVVAQSLDTLMDVFSEDDQWLHGLYLACSTHAKVKEAHKSLKAKARSSSEGLDRDAVAHIKEVLLNTSRFLKYKENFGV